jgi:hypothetical protein
MLVRSLLCHDDRPDGVGMSNGPGRHFILSIGCWNTKLASVVTNKMDKISEEFVGCLVQVARLNINEMYI